MPTPTPVLKLNPTLTQNFRVKYLKLDHQSLLRIAACPAVPTTLELTVKNQYCLSETMVLPIT